MRANAARQAAGAAHHRDAGVEGQSRTPRFCAKLINAGVEICAADLLEPTDFYEGRHGRSRSDLTDIITRAPLTLSMTAEPFEYPRSDWPDSVVMVGPCTWEPPAPPPSWLEEMSEPIVLVTTSSEFQDDHRLVRVTLDCLADQSLRVVATLPGGDPAALGTLEVPPNAHVERFLPHETLLRRAVCAVTHGGMGATQKALAPGVPVCAVPFGRDQFEVARRVEVAGAGCRLPAKHLTPERLRAKVREAIHCGAGARRVAVGLLQRAARRQPPTPSRRGCSADPSATRGTGLTGALHRLGQRTNDGLHDPRAS